MNSNGRILYICHDCLEPSGGVKVIYSHVSHLVRNGFPSFVVHINEGFTLPWLKSNVPVLYAKNGFRVSPNDIVVIPEDNKTAIRAFRDVQARKYIFCQNHYYIFKGIRDGKSWADYGISRIFCCSDIISRFIRSVFEIGEVPVIHNAVCSDIFKPREKKLQVAYMPRKTPGELDFIKTLFRFLFKQYQQVPWVRIDNVNEEKVAEILSESEIFLSTSIYEGLGLPPIEAMACGCVVVGFHGDGGLEYASRDNGFWCEEGNLVECARTLGHVIGLINKKDKTVEKIKAGAQAKAAQYSSERQQRELIDFWSKEFH
ncbi:MAG: glycosyltransferase [Candidatus Scalindua sp.]|nr:glycosyltransferase [Candidatus Scalindua sp.]